MKQAVMVWLKVVKNCDILAQEVNGFSGKNNRYIADVVGLKTRLIYPPLGVRRPNYRRFSLHVVEVKVSRKDFRNGYCSKINTCYGTKELGRSTFRAHFYVCTPPGLVRPEEVEPHVGLLECDLDQFRWNRCGGMEALTGFRLIKPPKAYQDNLVDGLDYLIRLAKKTSSEWIYHSPWVSVVDVLDL